jgi:hypothetical protein
MDKNDPYAMLFVSGLVAVQVGFFLLHAASVGVIATWPMLKVASPILGLLGLSLAVSIAGLMHSQFVAFIGRRRTERFLKMRDERQREWERMQRDPKLSKRLN